MLLAIKVSTYNATIEPNLIKFSTKQKKTLPHKVGAFF